MVLRYAIQVMFFVKNSCVVRLIRQLEISIWLLDLYGNLLVLLARVLVREYLSEGTCT